MNKKSLFFGLAGLLASLLSTSACAVASMSFSGGNGNPLVFTLNQSIQYTVTGTPPAYSPFFGFRNVGNVLGGSRPGVSGTMTYSVNGGSMLTLVAANTGFRYADVVETDLYFYGPNYSNQGPNPAGWLHAGDVVTLWAGELTTTNTFGFAPPTNGEFSTFLFDTQGYANSTAGVALSAIPEPEAYALMLAGLAVVVGAAARRRKAARLLRKRCLGPAVRCRTDTVLHRADIGTVNPSRGP
jgi:hypothetical protein